MPRLRHDRRFEALSAGAFVFRDNCAWLVGRHTPAFTFAGYAGPVPRPCGHASLLTPRNDAQGACRRLPDLSCTQVRKAR